MTDECGFSLFVFYLLLSVTLQKKMQNMMAHIRYATRGPVSLENVHPFTRELWGIQWTFAHNGDCPKFSNVHCSFKDMPVLGQTLNSGGGSCFCYHPVGDTDSEAVFCAILNAIKAEFPSGLPTLSMLHEFLQELCRDIVNNNDDEEHATIFNFLLGCGQYTLFAYSWPGSRPGSSVWNGLHYIVRQPAAPFSTATLLDDSVDVDENDHRVAVITTKPLTREAGWCEMKRGELIMFDHGRPHFTAACCETVELEGRGLCSKVFDHFPKKTICRSRSSSSISTSSTSSSSNISSSSSNNKYTLHHHHGGHHQQEQTAPTMPHLDNPQQTSSSLKEEYGTPQCTHRNNTQTQTHGPINSANISRASLTALHIDVNPAPTPTAAAASSLTMEMAENETIAQDSDNDNDGDKSSSSTIKSDVENTFNSCSSSNAAIDVTISIAAGKCCYDVAPAPYFFSSGPNQ